MKISDACCGNCELGAIWQDLDEQVLPFVIDAEAHAQGMLEAHQEMSRLNSEEEVSTAEQAHRDQATAYTDERTFAYAAEIGSSSAQVMAAIEDVSAIDCGVAKREDATTKCPRLAQLIPMIIAINAAAQENVNHIAQSPRPEL